MIYRKGDVVDVRYAASQQGVTKGDRITIERVDHDSVTSDEGYTYPKNTILRLAPRGNRPLVEDRLWEANQTIAALREERDSERVAASHWLELYTQSHPSEALPESESCKHGLNAGEFCKYCANPALGRNWDEENGHMGTYDRRTQRVVEVSELEEAEKWAAGLSYSHPHLGVPWLNRVSRWLRKNP